MKHASDVVHVTAPSMGRVSLETNSSCAEQTTKSKTDLMLIAMQEFITISNIFHI